MNSATPQSRYGRLKNPVWCRRCVEDFGMSHVDSDNLAGIEGAHTSIYIPRGYPCKNDSIGTGRVWVWACTTQVHGGWLVFTDVRVRIRTPQFQLDDSGLTLRNHSPKSKSESWRYYLPQALISVNLPTIHKF